MDLAPIRIQKLARRDISRVGRSFHTSNVILVFIPISVERRWGINTSPSLSVARLWQSMSYNVPKCSVKESTSSAWFQGTEAAPQIFNLFSFHNESIMKEIFRRTAESRSQRHNSKSQYTFDYCTESQLLKLDADGIWDSFHCFFNDKTRSRQAIIFLCPFWSSYSWLCPVSLSISLYHWEIQKVPDFLDYKNRVPLDVQHLTTKETAKVIQAASTTYSVCSLLLSGTKILIFTQKLIP